MNVYDIKREYNLDYTPCVMPIKTEWLNKLLSGEKKIEYREFKKYWSLRLNLTEKYYLTKAKNGTEIPNHYLIGNKYIFFTAGYSSNCRKALAEVEKYEILDNGIDTDLKFDGKTIAIHIKNIKEV